MKGRELEGDAARLSGLTDTQIFRQLHGNLDHRLGVGQQIYCGAAQPALHTTRKPVLHRLAQRPAVHMPQKAAGMRNKMSLSLIAAMRQIF